MLVGNGMFDAGIASDTGVRVGDWVVVGGPGARVGVTAVAGVLVGTVAGEGTGVESAPAVHAMPIATTRARPSHMTANFTVVAPRDLVYSARWIVR